MTCPICRIDGRSPISSATCAIAVSARSATSASVSLSGQVVVDDLRLAAFLRGEFAAAVLGVDLGGLAALLGLLRKQLQHLVVAEFTSLATRDLRILNRRENHP